MIHKDSNGGSIFYFIHTISLNIYSMYMYDFVHSSHNVQIYILNLNSIAIIEY